MEFASAGAVLSWSPPLTSPLCPVEMRLFTRSSSSPTESSLQCDAADVSQRCWWV
ncbi:uncharacterized [Tachysurus ichikawai]